jgi:adenine-specific DNA methylase
MWAIEYHCPDCKPGHKGRFFKQPERADCLRYEAAVSRLALLAPELPIPDGEIPTGDETLRLHRWGYRRYREMFNDRQLLGLGVLLGRILETPDAGIRHALLTVFSDFLRYQNMLCRYDTYALKCQDIFSVHGFPVGLVQCENNLLGIPRVGSGSFRHFIEKYRRAKEYCVAPFETRYDGRHKSTVPIVGERIEAQLVEELTEGAAREAVLLAAPATDTHLRPASLDGVFTDPPYFDNVQYAELMDFCFSWLRIGLAPDFPNFHEVSTRSTSELTGNITAGRGLDHFTQGLSDVFRHYAAALKPGAPFVFTYHHNDPMAYLPIVVAILDANLNCTATLPVPAEMGASLHIARTGSSVLDSVFVCRADGKEFSSDDIQDALTCDAAVLQAAGLRLSNGDLRCLFAGHSARVAVNTLHGNWELESSLSARMARAKQELAKISANSRHLILTVDATKHSNSRGTSGEMHDTSIRA